MSVTLALKSTSMPDWLSALMMLVMADPQAASEVSPIARGRGEVTMP